jgi:hypothetical protein
LSLAGEIAADSLFFSPLYVYSIFYIKDNTEYYDDGRRKIKRGIIPHRITVDIYRKMRAEW